MALPNGAGGYQIGDGNVGEAQLFVQGAPTALTAAATATAAQLANGLFTFNGTAGNLTLPTVADLEADVSSASKVNAALTLAALDTAASKSATVGKVRLPAEPSKTNRPFASWSAVIVAAAVMEVGAP